MAKRRVMAGAPPAIEKHAAAVRLEALLAERTRLLKEIEKKRRLIARAQAEALRVSEQAFTRMRPIVERERALTATLTELFEELLAPGRLKPRERREVARIRGFLVLHGVLPSFDVEDDDFVDDEPELDPPPWEAPPRHADSARSSMPPEVESAAQPGQQRRSLRDIFRNLARLVHPDRARQASERDRRTEVMKQVTRAYEEGDLARLIEIERDWRSEAEVTEGDPDTRAHALERTNRELLDQLRALTAELRDSKRQVRDAEESRPDESLVALAQRELDQIESVLVLLERFRDGNASAADLRFGPWAEPSGRRRARANR